MDKTTKIALGLIAALGFGYFLFKRPDSSSTQNDPTGWTGNSSGNGNMFSASNVAHNLYLAMKDWGTDEEAILQELKYVTPSQFGLVVKAFGYKPYNKITGDQTYFIWETLPKLSLKQWLANELTSSEYSTLKQKYSAYL